MSPTIFINEVHPNQESGSEWIELFLVETDLEVNLLNYTIFDSARQIYKFSNENFNDQLLVVEVSGLNNDQDSVVLKDNLGNVLDSFSYFSTQKGLSWARIGTSSEFSLMEPSRNQINPTPTPTPTLNPTASASPTPNPSLSPTTAPGQGASVAGDQPNSTDGDGFQATSPLLQISQYPHYLLDKIQLQAAASTREERLSRLVFLGQKTAPIELKNAIIGSLLLIFASTYLLYAKFQKNHS